MMNRKMLLILSMSVGAGLLWPANGYSQDEIQLPVIQIRPAAHSSLVIPEQSIVASIQSAPVQSFTIEAPFQPAFDAPARKLGSSWWGISGNQLYKRSGLSEPWKVVNLQDEWGKPIRIKTNPESGALIVVTDQGRIRYKQDRLIDFQSNQEITASRQKPKATTDQQSKVRVQPPVHPATDQQEERVGSYHFNLSDVELVDRQKESVVIQFKSGWVLHLIQTPDSYKICEAWMNTPAETPVDLSGKRTDSYQFTGLVKPDDNRKVLKNHSSQPFFSIETSKTTVGLVSDDFSISPFWSGGIGHLYDRPNNHLLQAVPDLFLSSTTLSHFPFKVNS